MLECNDDHKLCMNRDAQRIFGTRKFSSLLLHTTVCISEDVIVKFSAGTFKKSWSKFSRPLSTGYILNENNLESWFSKQWRFFCQIFVTFSKYLNFSTCGFYYSVYGEKCTWLKFMFSKKATKIDEIFTVDLTLCSKCQIDGEDFINFCGLLRKHEL